MRWGQHLEGRGRQYPKPHPLTVDGQQQLGAGEGQPNAPSSREGNFFYFFFLHTRLEEPKAWAFQEEQI